VVKFARNLFDEFIRTARSNPRYTLNRSEFGAVDLLGVLTRLNVRLGKGLSAHGQICLL
jgi:hypothetical protein